MSDEHTYPVAPSGRHVGTSLLPAVGRVREVSGWAQKTGLRWGAPC